MAGLGLAWPMHAQHSAARLWNEELLRAIRIDFARPTVHSRNLFHSSAAMYDAWAAYDSKATPYILGKSHHGVVCTFERMAVPADIKKAREETISYAQFRLLSHRFKKSPGANLSLARFANLMNQLGYDTSRHSTNYIADGPAALGNYIAQCVITFGLQDGSNEINNYQNRFYNPINPPIDPTKPGNPTLLDPNRWQPITLKEFIDQSGNPIPGSVPSFLNAEWGSVTPFAMMESEAKKFFRNRNTYTVYHDPGAPPYHGTGIGQNTDANYKWEMNLVSVWSSHLSPADAVMWDISPASLGNSPPLPTAYSDYPNFYKLVAGGDAGTGRPLNPSTGLPYQPNYVLRGDYTRVLAEFWADGPDSETPPGHWFALVNYISDHPSLIKKFRGVGGILDNMEWDVKAYFALGGALHDAAVTAWGIKGWYDYIRPLSGIRFLADAGQSSDPGQANYNPEGITLLPGYVELVGPADALAGASNEHVNKIKIRAWKGPGFIANPETDVAGVDWILAGNWWPYQRPTFVTPPFAGFISGHSTFSRAAAELLTLFTGDEFFPGGMGQFIARQNEFLVFEEGPSQDVVLQWATYRDASDQTSLSRIWGGIHVPADDIVGRKIGKDVGIAAFLFAEKYFDGLITSGATKKEFTIRVYPNPAQTTCWIEVDNFYSPITVTLLDLQGKPLRIKTLQPLFGKTIAIDLTGIQSGLYLVRAVGEHYATSTRLLVP